MEAPNRTICSFKFCSLPLMTNLQKFFALYLMKIADVIEVLAFSIEKVSENNFWNVWEPCF